MSEGTVVIGRDTTTLSELPDKKYIVKQADNLAFLMGQEPDGREGNLEHELFNAAEDALMSSNPQILVDYVARELSLPPDKKHLARSIFNEAYRMRSEGAYKEGYSWMKNA